MADKKTTRTDEEKRLAWNAYIREYNRRRREENKQELKQVIKLKYDNEILGGKKDE